MVKANSGVASAASDGRIAAANQNIMLTFIKSPCGVPLIEHFRHASLRSLQTLMFGKIFFLAGRDKGQTFLTPPA
jgi:hypothetical protein